jgi:cardiolipin synthase A/B
MHKTAWLSLALLLAACHPEKGSTAIHLAHQVPTDSDGFGLALFQSVDRRLEPGNHGEWVENGRVFDATEEAIRGAKTSVHILVFIWRDGVASNRLISALESRKEDHLDCRVMVDGVGSKDFEKDIQGRLQSAGCDVRHFGKYGENSKRRAMARNHRKLVIVDGQLGITGGFGIQDEWMGDGLSEKEWRDTNIVVRGPVVAQMQGAFAQNWQELGGALLPQAAFPPLAPEGGSLAAFVPSTGSDTMTSARRLTHLMFEAPRRRLWISNSYFVPSDDLVQLLIRRKAEGVEVRVLVPGDIHDVPPVLESQRATYPALLAGGVRIFEYQPSMMHAKTMVVDDSLIVVGSMNLDALSLEKLDEGSMVLEDRALASHLAGAFENDLTHAKEITHAEKPRLFAFRQTLRKLFWFSSVGVSEQ